MHTDLGGSVTWELEEIGDLQVLQLFGSPCPEGVCLTLAFPV